MAKKNEAKIKFLAETQGFREGITQANSTLSELNSELKLNAEQMKTNGVSVDALTERHELLQDKLKQAESKTENLSAQMESCARNYGENSIEAQKLATQINNAKIAEEKIRQEINKVNQELAAQSVESIDTRNELEKLEDTISEQESEMKNLQRAYADAVLTYGETSYGALEVARNIEKLSGELNENRAKMSKAQDAAENLGKAMDDIDDGSDDTRNALEKLQDTISDQESALSDLKGEYAAAALEYGKNSKEARTLARQISDLSGELNENKGKMSLVETAADNLAGDVKDAGEAAEDAGDGFSVWKGTLADLASSGIQSILSGVQGLASSFWNLGDETRELRTNLGKVEVAFGDSGLSAEQAASTYENFYGIVADEGQATEAVSHLAKICDSQEDLTEWTTIATGVYGTFGDSLPLESLTEAANETIKVGTVTGSLADALNWSTMSSEDWQKAFKGHPKALKKFQNAMKKGLSVEDAFNEALTKCTTESEREQVIRQALTGLYGDAAAAYEETNGEIMDANRAQAEYNTALAGLGEVIEPIKTVFMDGMAGMLESATELFDSLDMDSIKGSIKNAFGYINDTVIPAVKDGINWFIDNKDLVVAGLSAIVAGMLAFKVVTIIQTAVGIFKAFQAATTGLTLAQKLLNIVMMANPIAIIVALIVGLVAAFIVLWNKCEWFRNFWIGLWENIKSMAATVVDVLSKFFTETIPQAWNSFKEYCSTLWSGIWSTISTAASNIWSSVTTWFSNLRTSAVNIWQNLKNSVVNAFLNTKEKVVQTASNLWSNVTTWFSNLRTSAVNIWQNLKNSVVNAFTSVRDKTVSVAGNIWQKITAVFTRVKDKVTSIWDGIKSAIQNPIESARDLVDNAISKIRGLFDFEFKWPKLPMPHFSVSGSMNPLKWIDEGVPKISVDWYAKGGILEKPTLFGMGSNGNLLGGGEAGAEAVAPIDVLLDYVRQAVQEVFGAMMAVNLDNADAALSYVDSLENHLSTGESGEISRLIDAIEDLAARPIDLNIDGMRFATATAGASDSVSGNRLNLKTRGLVLP